LRSFLEFINERVTSAIMAVSGLTIFALVGFDYRVFEHIIEIICLIMVNIGLKNYFKEKKWSELSVREKIIRIVIVAMIAAIILSAKYFSY
jgi:amino acid transporter